MQEETQTGIWWTEADSQNFIDFGRYFVPERETQLRTICDLIMSSDTPFEILELCCGEGLLAGALLERFSKATVHGFDGSPEMLKQAGTTLASYGKRFQTRQFDLAETNWREMPARFGAVVSSLAVHHLNGIEKQTLFRDVLAMLKPGGSLIIADIIEPAGSAGTDLAAKDWDEATHQRALELDGNTDAFEYFQREKWNYFRYPDPYDKPSSLFEQLKWLDAAGFVEVDVFWLKAGHAIYGGRKPGDD